MRSQVGEVRVSGDDDDPVEVGRLFPLYYGEKFDMQEQSGDDGAWHPGLSHTFI